MTLPWLSGLPTLIGPGLTPLLAAVLHAARLVLVFGHDEYPLSLRFTFLERYRFLSRSPVAVVPVVPLAADQTRNLPVTRLCMRPPTVGMEATPTVASQR